MLRAILGIWLGPKISRITRNRTPSSAPPSPNTFSSWFLRLQMELAAIAPDHDRDLRLVRAPRLPDHRRAAEVVRHRAGRRRILRARHDHGREVVEPVGVLHVHDVEPAFLEKRGDA